MLALVHHVRRRLLGKERLAQAANVWCAALFVLILLLLLGTEMLSWYWVALVPALSACAALFLVHRRVPGPYAVAQMVDARLALADTLSTAVYFGQTAASGVRERQREQAERLAAAVDPRRAAPYSVPRTVYLAAGWTNRRRARIRSGMEWSSPARQAATSRAGRTRKALGSLAAPPTAGNPATPAAGPANNRKRKPKKATSRRLAATPIAARQVVEASGRNPGERKMPVARATVRVG